MNGESLTAAQVAARYRDFLISTALPDNNMTRYGFTNTLADELLLLRWAEETGFFRDQEHQSKLAALAEQELLDLLYRLEIKSASPVSDAYLRQLFAWSKVRLHTRHLFSRDYATATTMYDAVQRGADWDSLASLYFQDPELAGAGGDLGFTSIGDLDPSYEIVAYSLADGEISEPVQTEYGYSIIQVVERETDPFSAEDEFQKDRTKLERLAWTFKKRPAVKAYTDDLIAELNIRFDDTILEDLPADPN
ncbi:MAG: peptidylprolyl isomerase, partial [Candidatus Marinimicrobia bacterium]|nr:peptidylprolyl isomerase [Candidatus Neomarinimicrobiota bacterium]